MASICGVLQCVAVCCSVLQHIYTCLCEINGEDKEDGFYLQCVAVCCSVLQCVAKCLRLPWRDQQKCMNALRPAYRTVCVCVRCVCVCVWEKFTNTHTHTHKVLTHEHTYFTFVCVYTYSHAPSLDRQKSTNALLPAHRKGCRLTATGRYFLSTTLVWSGRGRAVEVWRGGTCVYVFVCVSQCVCAWVVECVCVYVRECEYYVGG